MKMLKFASISLCTLAAFNSQAAELKLGIMQHDFDRNLGHRCEKGQNINIEYLFERIDDFLYVIPHVGASINNHGYTSNVYTGFSWQLDFGKYFFAEASLGGSINNAQRKIRKKRRGLGANLLFRESVSLGIRWGEQHSISIMIDHISNARITNPNPGLTDIGIRYGYRF